MAEQKGNFGTAMSQVLKAYTEKKKNEIEFQSKLEMERLKSNEDYARDVAKAQMQNRMTQQRQQDVYQYKKKDEEMRKAGLEQVYSELKIKESQGPLSVKDRTRLTVVEKRLGIWKEDSEVSDIYDLEGDGSKLESKKPSSKEDGWLSNIGSFFNKDKGEATVKKKEKKKEELDEEYEVDAVYENENGEQAKYLGGGEWELL